jgi:LTXXQ motif family protein
MCEVMRKIGPIFGITALAAVVFSPLPAAAFGIRVGPFYFHVPFGHHHSHHHTYMRAEPREARTRPSNDVSRGGSYGTAAREGAAAKTGHADREARTETNTEALESCTGLAPGVTNPPIDQIRQTIHLTTDQQAALDDLAAASSQARDVIKSSCPASVPLTPVGRLDSAEQQLDATIKAAQIVRSPLERFYLALNDDQRRQLDAITGSAGNARSAADMAALCTQQGSGLIDLPVQRIEEVVQPTARQQGAFDDLKKVTQNAGDQLKSSCPTAVPNSPVARLDTIEARLSAMADAIKAVRANLENFYASLSNDQKARFNMMGPPPKLASPQSER